MKTCNFKKTLIIIAIALITVTANAQWFIGGGLGLRVRNSKSVADEKLFSDETAIGFSIAPKGGYYFNEKFAIGLSFLTGYEHQKTSKMLMDYPMAIERNIFQWRISPFVRYSVFTYKKFSLILEGTTGVGGSYLVQDFKGYDNLNRRSFLLGIGVINVAPVLGYKLTEHLQLEAGLYFLNLGYNIGIANYIEGDNKTTYTTHEFNIGFNSSNIFVVSQLTIGAIYKF
jgi:hypothetical protein